MTKKLYYTSSYTTEWETKIINILDRNGEYYVVLEETAFYPNGGGQPCDTGYINGIAVLDVFIEDNEVFHKLEDMPKNDDVTCQINWNRRFDHMQHHSGQHLLSAVCLNLFHAKTISFHLGEEFASIDVDQPDLTQFQLASIEQEVNKQIYINRSIHSYFVTNEKLKEIVLVKKPKVTGNIRIVEIEGIEYNACGGTHVTRTGEIGIIKLIKAEKQKGSTRIYFKCGYRALNDFMESQRILGTLASKFNTGRSDILDRFGKWEQEHKQLENDIENLKEQLHSYQAKELLNKASDHFLAHIFEDKSLKELQHLASKLVKENDLLILFASTVENKIVLMHNGTKSLKCGNLFKVNLNKFNGKGGGNDKSAQAGFPSNEETLKFYHFISQNVMTEH
ncbi:alanyl-tRNA editing protein [Metabacillus sediminilitoris]|uniref:Hydrolase n=1 Tax=Metabacillus sediminilitoris TaxID=2567941 RepID=A0A4S4BVQ1_9BACI|nr:DHHA1 domain-containing protein [Metabacillus sediminilitoris]QGQ46181.1 hydrolase [Metabacillus sediminilitoris]THF79234.1 hydrolase [Metabacillus sediminilitoris]